MEIQELERELNEMKSRMDKEFEECGLLIGERAAGVGQSTSEGNPDAAVFAEMLQQKPPDFDQILSKLQENKQQVKELENDLVQQQREIELLLREDQRKFVIGNAAQQVIQRDNSQIDMLDDLDKRINQELNEDSREVE